MIRRRQLLPDQQIHTETYGPVPCISAKALDEMMLDLAAMLRFAGGNIQAAVTRHPTDFPGEMVTIHAAFEWKDHTRAGDQPERSATPADLDTARERLQQEWVPLPDMQEEPAPEDDPEYEPEPSFEVEQSEPTPDGLDYTELPEEDLDAIPAEQR